MLAAFLATLVATATPVKTVLVLPVEARSGVARDTAEQVTQLLVSHAARQEGYRVTSFREVEGTLTAAQVRQVAGCDSTSCAAEIAGALNADELVMGTLGKLGDNFVLSVTRIRARDASAVGRVSETFARLDENAIVQRLPSVTRRLFGDDVPRPEDTPPPAAPSAPDTPPSPGARFLLPLGAAALGASLLGGAAVAACTLAGALLFLSAFSIGSAQVGPTLPGPSSIRALAMAAAWTVAALGTVATLALLSGGTITTAIGAFKKATE